MTFTYAISITIEQALFFNLFDNIVFEYVKDLVMMDKECRENTDLEIKIEDIPCSRQAYSRVRFTFDLDAGYMDKTFSTELEYSNCGAYALELIKLQRVICPCCEFLFDKDGEDHDYFRISKKDEDKLICQECADIEDEEEEESEFDKAMKPEKTEEENQQSDEKKKEIEERTFENLCVDCPVGELIIGDFVRVWTGYRYNYGRILKITPKLVFVSIIQTIRAKADYYHKSYGGYITEYYHFVNTTNPNLTYGSDIRLKKSSNKLIQRCWRDFYMYERMDWSN